MRNEQNNKKAKCHCRNGNAKQSPKQDLKALKETDLLSIGEMAHDNGGKGKAQGCWYDCIPSLPKAKK